MIHFSKYKKSNIDEDTIFCLDIEVSSFWIDEKNNIIEYDNTLTDEYYNKCKKGSCVYIWQFSIEDTIYYGREFNDLYAFIQTVRNDITFNNRKHNMVIYVHNLAYEFAFLRNLPFNWVNVFARTLRKPMKAVTDNHIEFKCSYMLTNLSLESWGKQLGVSKKVGDLDYTKLRTPLTHLTSREMGYCEYDLKIMIEGLKKFREQYEHIHKIPLTSTGRVRRVIKEIYKDNYKYHKHITHLQPTNSEMYKIYKAVFGGGDTHAHIVNVNRVLKSTKDNQIKHIDETSAYPRFLCSKKFPQAPFYKINNTKKLNFDRYCYIFCIKMEKVQLKGTLSYISKGRCKVASGTVEDNGRIVKANLLILYATCQDYKMIKRLYDFDETIISCYRSKKGYLDKEYIKYVLKLFSDKTTLKGVKGVEDLYLQQKAFLNSLYGMQVTDLIQPIIQYEYNEWKAVPQFEQDIQKGLDDVQKKWYNNNTAYIHGLYVTSYARYELWDTILAISEYDDITGKHNNDVIYFDTDSIFYFNGNKYNKLIEERNKVIIEELEEAMKHHGLPLDIFKPIAPNGKQSILGTWTYEEDIDEMKTLGAKKYITVEKGEMHLTCSGVPKKAVKSLNTIDDFQDGYIFTSDDCKKGLSHYIDGDNYTGYLKDGYYLNQPYGLNIRNVGYTVGLTADFKKIIQTLIERGEIK